MTITNCNPGVVIVGVRVLVGCQAIDKAPSFIEVFGRAIDIELKRNRWFDLPFTREEVLSTDRTITITCMNVNLSPSFKIILRDISTALINDMIVFLYSWSIA